MSSRLWAEDPSLSVNKIKGLIFIFIYYVEHVSFLLDVKMVLKTIKIVFSKSEMRTNSNRVKFDGKNLLETRTKKQILEDEQNKAEKPARS